MKSAARKRSRKTDGMEEQIQERVEEDPPETGRMASRDGPRVEDEGDNGKST